MTATATALPPLRVEPHSEVPLVLYGDFTCPWTYLAQRRLGELAAAGIRSELRAVEHAPSHPRRTGGADGFADLRAEMDEVVQHLLADEQYPYTLAGFVPHTYAAVNGYAEAYGAGAGPVAAPVLFEAFWRHGMDLDEPKVVRTLLTDAVMGGTSPSDPLRRWGFVVGVTGAPMTTTAWRLVGDWRAEWTRVSHGVVPVLVQDGRPPIVGVDVVTTLAELVHRLGVHPAQEPQWAAPHARRALDGHGRTQLLYPTPAAAS
ncbi:MAG TPA: hypothetical protein VGK60_02775 [Pedococcus sp.]|jgi:hypothetical protein